ncbi:MAG: GIY-YIG nuclease family protein [Burkholderiales bacterium]
MTRSREFYVYILTNKSNRVLYTGVTNDLKRRVYEHQHDFVEGFTKKYRVHILVYYEVAGDAYAAIAREKQIKAGSRQKKLNLIKAFNPDWHDLYDEI